jgi:Asp-tRNA(Asn)/Glu-tRNA(Gln) amidotransferase A subunit family amidase
MDILCLDATDQLQALAALRISARELLEASVVRLDRLNPRLNAVVSRDLDHAYSTARMIDERRARGETLGLLGGLPMTVKDTFDVEGLPASAGVKALLDRTSEDAEVVARVRSADAIVWGKTNTPVHADDWQTYNSLYGTTSNPWDLTRTPGGSSGGSAAAVAAGITARRFSTRPSKFLWRFRSQANLRIGLPTRPCAAARRCRRSGSCGSWPDGSLGARPAPSPFDHRRIANPRAGAAC